jgi:hypothetical protein
MPSAGFEPSSPASERPKFCAVDSADTAIGHWTSYTTNIKTGLQFTSTPPYTVPAMPHHLSYHNNKAAHWAVRWAGARVCGCVCFSASWDCVYVFRVSVMRCEFQQASPRNYFNLRLGKKFAWPWSLQGLLLRHTMWASYQACKKRLTAYVSGLLEAWWTQCHNRPATNRSASWKGILQFVQPKDVLEHPTAVVS